MTGAVRQPAVGADLYHHAPPAQLAIARDIQPSCCRRMQGNLVLGGELLAGVGMNDWRITRDDCRGQFTQLRRPGHHSALMGRSMRRSMSLSFSISWPSVVRWLPAIIALIPDSRPFSVPSSPRERSRPPAKRRVVEGIAKRNAATARKASPIGTNGRLAKGVPGRG